MRELKDIASLVNVAQGGAKRALFDRIATLGSGVERVEENTFKYSRPAVEGEMGDVMEVIKPPLWVELQGQLVIPVDGIDMATGALFGFYGPTNQENATGGVRHNYLVGETINRCDLDRKVFGPPYPPPLYDGHTACQYSAYVWNNEMDKRQKRGLLTNSKTSTKLSGALPVMSIFAVTVTWNSMVTHSLR